VHWRNLTAAAALGELPIGRGVIAPCTCVWRASVTVISVCATHQDPQAEAFHSRNVYAFDRADGGAVVLVVPPADLPDALQVAASSNVIKGLLVLPGQHHLLWSSPLTAQTLNPMCHAHGRSSEWCLSAGRDAHRDRCKDFTRQKNCCRANPHQGLLGGARLPRRRLCALQGPHPRVEPVGYWAGPAAAAAAGDAARQRRRG